MDADEPGFWVPDEVHFGKVEPGERKPKHVPITAENWDEDDDEDAPTDPDVIMMLGFDPRDVDWDEDLPEVVTDQD